MERIQQIRNQFGETFSSLSVAQKAGIASALALTIAALGWIVASASSTPYATLFANMPESQLARVIATQSYKKPPDYNNLQSI